MFGYRVCLLSCVIIIILLYLIQKNDRMKPIISPLLFQISQLGEKRFENPQTSNLHYILVDCLAIHELMEEKRSHEELGLEVEEGQRGGRRQQVSEILYDLTIIRIVM